MMWTVLATTLAALAALYRWARQASRLSHPPGPRGLPIIGNLLDRPGDYSWITYRQWSRDYGSDLIRTNTLGSNIVVVNSYDAAIDLLDKRGTTYSNRPTFTMLGELCGFCWQTTLMQYDNAWKSGRKVLQREIGPNSVKEHRPHITRGTHHFLRAVRAAPEDILKHLRLMAGVHILGIAYGLNIRDDEDPYLTDAKISSECFSAMAFPGAYIVDTIPLLKYIPAWFPGAGFQRQAREWNKAVSNVRDRPFEAVKAHMAQGDAADCAAKALLNALESTPDLGFAEGDIKSALGTMYAAGSDTTLSTLGFFALAMVLYPGIQEKAQRMLDEICPGRLPTMDDQPELPYIDGLVKEALRWHPVVPLCLPHTTTEDDVYKGYFIPKGTSVVVNSWAILHDEETYPEPHHFNPDRWLKDGKLNPAVRDPNYAFGGGRRVCPGRFMAYEAMWLTIACLLTAFEFSKVKDEDGNLITPTEELLCGMMCFVKPFKYAIRPRSKEHEALVQATEGNDY